MSIKRDLTFEQGADYSERWRYRLDGVEQDCSGYVVRAELRNRVGGVVLLNLAQYFTYRPGVGVGTFDFHIPGADLAVLLRGGVYDVFLVDVTAPLTDPGLKLASGKVKLIKAVTGLV